MTFEENLKRLEAIVHDMESGTLDLDSMLRKFEEGQELVATCQKDFASLRQRIDKVTKAGTAEPFNP